ncbi:hypothetical protein KQX54_005085 [Cotesia glomerata]|uniref:Nucleolar protein 4 helical domain-containing protein n=1 Tax=Cotesia glomerata TaxID=32391 RepID=A0AAV7I1G9_COTGL|nr:hypothetical protein KQX54_005085 [Cotesia glomerata]
MRGVVTVDGKKLTGEEIPLLGLAAGEGMSRFPNTLGRLPTTRLSTRGICMQMARVTIETRGLSLLGSNYPSENISTPEPADITEDDHYSTALMKDADKLKLMLLAWNYNLQQQAQAQAASAALSPNNSTTTTANTIGTPVTSQSTISTANNTINNCTLTDSRNGTSELGELSSGVPNLGAVAGVGGEDMASLWASYAMGLKKTPPPASSCTPSRSDRDRESSPTGGEGAGSAQDETSSSGNKEDEDDDDEDVDERLDPRHHDPERLKAFNMFVRLFVDENLDRIVPISKQPKEKIQAIIDSCTRQFPEFAERARKRIRTYLKSCRRNKRGREGAPWDAARPTPAHLTSVQAEQILATACENESDNAKRMRLGLEPVSQPMPTLPAATVSEPFCSKETNNSPRINNPPLALPLFLHLFFYSHPHPCPHPHLDLYAVVGLNLSRKK